MFAVDEADYALISNHYHVVFRIGSAQAASSSLDELLVRWKQLFAGHPMSKQKDGFHHVIGRKTSVRDTAAKLGMRFLQGIVAAERLFPQRI